MQKDVVVGIRPINIFERSRIPDSLEERMEKCLKEINDILDKYDMVITITNEINVVPKDE